MKKKMIALDADYLIFLQTEGKRTQAGFFGSEEGEVKSDNYKESLKIYKKQIKASIKDVEDEVAANLPGQVKGIKVFFSDPDTNFRYDIYPEYKASRKSGQRSKLFYRLRKWVLKKYGYVKNVEADDVVAYYVREKGWIGASFDKDLLEGVAGIWFDTYHSRRHIKLTTPDDADYFNLLQTLAGDPTDNIKGIPRVGMKTAANLLVSNGESWSGVVQSYLNAGLTEDDAILNLRLTSMKQWSPKKGVQLCSPKK